MDLLLVAAAMTTAREDDDTRYEGCVMWSALPAAPVVGATDRHARPAYARW